METLQIVIAVLLLALLSAILSAIKKGFDEVIKGLESMDDRRRRRQEK